MPSPCLHSEFDSKRTYQAAPGFAPARARASRVPGLLGFLLVDGDLNPIYANTEAVRILTYPLEFGRTTAIKKVLLQRIQSAFAARSVSKSSSVARIQSGKRYYSCRFFSVPRSVRANRQREIALLIERNA